MIQAYESLQARNLLLLPREAKAQMPVGYCQTGFGCDIFLLMNAITPTTTAAVVEDQDGTIRLTGSRIPLDTVVHEFNQGATAEQIQDSFPSLSLRVIYGAITFYLERQAEVDDYLRRREQEAGELQRLIENRPETAAFRERLRHRRAQMLLTS